MKTAYGSLALRLALLSIPAAALPALAEETETRALEGFDGVAVGGGIDLTLRQGDSFRVEVTADDLGDVITEVNGGTLEIKRPRTRGLFGWGNWGDSGSVEVTLPKLVELTASGGSEVATVGGFSGDRLDLVASGGSEVAIEAAVATLNVTASGGSDLRLSGSARTASVQSSGGSDLDASGLIADEADVNSSGGSDLAIGVRNRLVANASGGSDVSYSGEPSTVQVNSSGGGDVRRR
jgi:hypothetical protein